MKTVRRWLLLAILVSGCAKPGGTPKVSQVSKPAPSSALSISLLVDLGLETDESARDPKFALVETDRSHAKALLWDGQVGVNIGPDGTGHSSDGKHLLSFGNYYDKKENITATGSALEFVILANGAPVVPLDSGYSQCLDMRYGLLTTHWFAKVKGGALEARLSNIVRAGRLVSRWEFRAPIGTKIQVRGHSGWAQGFDALYPNSIPDSDAPKRMIFQDGDPEDQVTTLSEGKATFLAESDQDTSLTFAPDGLPATPMKSELQASKTRLGLSSIDVDGPLEDQQAINSFLYYLRTGVSSPNSYFQVSPFGLSSDRYNGHVFWDADVWVMPALAFIEPFFVQQQANYRTTLMQKPPLAPFPWESSVTGKEVAPGDSKKEIHISGSVLWGLEFAAALGAKVPSDVTKRVADYYVGRSTKRPDGKLGLENVMSPDEGHIGSNDLYTNLLAQWAINGATWNPAKKPAQEMYLPKDATSFLTYDGDQFRAYKQAAAVLAIYPLQYPPAEAEAKTMMNRFQDKIIAHGPAMADSIHAVIWAREGEPDKAYDLWKKSWSEFVQGPLLLFSEKRTAPATYFTTGAAGCLQSVIYGFLGFRVDEKPEAGAAWTKQLKNGRWLSIKPNLPSAWKSATFRNFHVLGSTYTVTEKRDGSKTVTSVKQGD